MVAAPALPAPPSLTDLAAALCNPTAVDLDRDPTPWRLGPEETEPDRIRLRRQQVAHIRQLVREGRGHEAVRLRRQYAAERLRRAPVPSLLDQVVDAVASSRGHGRGARRGGRPPLDPAAVDLLHEIERHVGPGRRMLLGRRVWAWVRAHHADPAAPDLLRSWVARARDIVEPPRPIGLAAACPACGARTVLVEDSGEWVRRTALHVDRATGDARCIAPRCGAVWGLDLLPHLASVLEQQRAEDEANRLGNRAHGPDTAP
jgi:hypothetical protein